MLTHVQYRNLPLAAVPMLIPPSLAHLVTGNIDLTLVVTATEVVGLAVLLLFVRLRWHRRKHLY